MSHPSRPGRNSPRAALLSLVTFLAACGGGGGGGAPATAPGAPVGNQPPVAVFSLSTTSGFAPLSVQFDASSSRDPDGTITDYQWNFGDGSAPTSGVSTSHVYDEPGSYSVSLTVTDNEGRAATALATVRARGARLTGTLSILPSSAVDSDVNDRLTTPTPNNSFATAQSLPNPVRLGGYLNLPGRGSSSGALFTSGDTSDFYAVNLTGNELIVLTAGDAAADLDLRLWDAAQNLVDASLGSGASESLTVPGPGAYFVEVLAFDGPTNIAGASNYVLGIGQDLSAGAGTLLRTTRRLSDRFVPGELLLDLVPGDTVGTSPSDTRARLRVRHRLEPGEVSGRTLRARLGAENREALRDAHLATLSDTQRAKYTTLISIKQLAGDPEIAHAEANTLAYPLLTPDDPFYSLQWHYPAISLPGAWDISTGGAAEPVIVAVVDTGILPQHPDLSNQLVAGYDFISSPGRARDGNGIDPDPTDEGDLAYGASSSFHGTHVAGTVAADSDNAIGVAGVSWQARIMPLRVLGVDGGTSFDISQAIRFAAGLSNSSGTLPLRRAEVINLSLGTDTASQTMAVAIADARAAGVIVIASAGNDASANPSYPAAFDGVVSVSATTIDDDLAPYSNFGASIDLAAPGGYNATDQNGDGIGDGVISALGDDSNPGPLLLGYGALSGTSMAAPHVAGVAALMKALHPGLTPVEFDNALIAGDLTDDLGPPGQDASYGFGRLNAQKSLLAALSLASGGGSDPGPVLSASTNGLSFGVLTTQLPLTLRNVGTGSIVIGSVTSSAAWLTATTTANTDANGLGEYLLEVDRTGLQTGAYAANVLFTPQDMAVNPVRVNVTLQVADINPVANAGLHYVIAVNDAGATVGNTAIVSVSNGVYNYSLDDIPPGRYRLFAGSDMDDDDFLCDGAESCGAYRTLETPALLDVDGRVTPVLTDLDFVVEFRAVFSATAQTSDGPSDAVVPGLTEGGQGIPISKPVAADPLEFREVER